MRADRLRHKDEDCFSPSVGTMNDDFDFEKNLALFDKDTVFSAIEQVQGFILADCFQRLVKKDV